MKSKCITLLMLFWSLNIFAQNFSDVDARKVDCIYLTIDSFRTGRCIMFHINPKNGDKVKLNQFINSPVIKVIQNGNTLRFNKDSIFAVHLSDGSVYRFIDQTSWKLSDTSYLYIYELKTTQAVYKYSGPRVIKHVIPETYYLFNNRNSEEVHLLTRSNLEKYVLVDEKLRKVINEKFPDNKSLHQINPETGHFGINELLLSAYKE